MAEQPEIFVEQDDTTTRLMLRAPGDKPVCLFSYNRRLAHAAESLTAIEIDVKDNPTPGTVIGVHVTVKETKDLSFNPIGDGVTLNAAPYPPYAFVNREFNVAVPLVDRPFYAPHNNLLVGQEVDLDNAQPEPVGPLVEARQRVEDRQREHQAILDRVRGDRRWFQRR